MFLRSITLKNLLSFKDTTLDLRPLNVIIGPNGAGKSNLIDAIGLLRAAPTDLNSELRRGGVLEDWVWKGKREEVSHGPDWLAPGWRISCEAHRREVPPLPTQPRNYLRYELEVDLRLPPGERQTVKTLFAVRWKSLDRQYGITTY